MRRTGARVLGWASVLMLLCGMAAAPPGGPVIAVKARKIHTGAGEAVSPGVILIRDGRILDVRPGLEVPEGAEIIDAGTQVVIPGLIDAMTSEAGQGDAAESITADVRAYDGYDPYASRRRTLAGGVTTTFVAPGLRRLLPGQGAVLKTGGEWPDSRRLRESHGLLVYLGELVKNPPFIYVPPVPPSAENPIQPARRQFPTSRMGEFALLREFFADAARASDSDPRRRAALAIAREALSGRRPLIVHARVADDIIKIIRLSDEFKLRVILAGATEAHKVADLLAERRIPVILDAGFLLEGPSSEGDPSLEAPAMLAKAGVTFAFTASSDTAMRDLLLTAGVAVRHGLSEAQALKAITLAPAEILGISDRVGSIAPGKDADLVFLNGDPFEGSAAPQRVMIDGRIAYELAPGDFRSDPTVLAKGRKAQDVVAIKGLTILTASEGTVADGTLLIESGRIVYMGRARSVPPQARVIDGSGLTAMPGLIDIQSHACLRQAGNELATRGAQGLPRPPSTSTGPITELADLSSPDVYEAARAGVTTLLLAPEHSGTCSLVKVAAEGSPATVLRAVAAIKLPVSRGPSGHRQLKEQIERARKYHEQWEQWEKAAREKEAAAKGTAPADPVSGSWKGTLTILSGGQSVSRPFTAELKLAGSDVTGTLNLDVSGKTESQEVKGAYLNGELRLKLKQGTAELEAVLKSAATDKFEGTLAGESQGQKVEGSATMTRQSAPATQAADEKKPPKKDDALEGYRPVFRREIPIIAVVRDAGAAENAVKTFTEDQPLDFFVLAPADADQAVPILTRNSTGVAVGHDFLRERDGAITNVAELFASAGLPVALCSGTGSESKLLPFLLTRAMRYGLAPSDALRCVTVNPARLLKLDQRLGSLARGRDGDVVLFSGDPFSLGSRIRMVLVDGKVVHEAK